jgi:hypothetical protein
MKLSLDEKIWGVSLIWKEAEYNFPFWKCLGDLDWDSAYKEVLPRIIATNTIREYYLELCRFISLLRDGHTVVRFPEKVYLEAGHLPISIVLIGTKWCVVNSDTSLDIPLYDEILTINGVSVTEYISKNIYPYCWHEKEDSASWHINHLLPIVEYQKEIKIQTLSDLFCIKATDREIKWKQNAGMKPKEKLIEIFSSKTHTISITDDNIAVISIQTFMEDDLGSEFFQNMPKIKNCNGYIIDIRDNAGGNSDNADCVVQAFIEGEFTYSTDRRMVHVGPYKAWGKNQILDEIDQSNEWCKKLYEICNRRYFECSSDKKMISECPFTLTAPLIVLENERTCSAAEDMLICFDAVGRATIVGTPSYGSTGQPLTFDLPGGGEGRICTRWCTYPNGKEFINIGVLPHVKAELSLDDLKNGYDSVMDEGIEILRKNLC